jgi:hypothetical protein
VETSPEAEAQGRARRSFLWRLRLDPAAVSLILAGGTAVGEGRAALFSCQISQWEGEVTAVTLGVLGVPLIMVPDNGYNEILTQNHIKQ